MLTEYSVSSQTQINSDPQIGLQVQNCVQVQLQHFEPIVSNLQGPHFWVLLKGGP